MLTMPLIPPLVKVTEVAFSEILECRLEDSRGCLVLWTRGGALYELSIEDDRQRYVLYKCIHFRRKVSHPHLAHTCRL